MVKNGVTKDRTTSRFECLQEDLLKIEMAQ